MSATDWGTLIAFAIVAAALGLQYFGDFLEHDLKPWLAKRRREPIACPYCRARGYIAPHPGQHWVR